MLFRITVETSISNFISTCGYRISISQDFEIVFATVLISLATVYKNGAKDLVELDSRSFHQYDWRGALSLN